MRIPTASGTLRGSVVRAEGGVVHRFLGVPYAASPVGALRFRPPREVAPWRGERSAEHPGPAAPQASEPGCGNNPDHTVRGSEEGCLNLNIWTPAADQRRRPVMVWIHGGAYLGGSNASALSDGAALAAAFDVVVVAVNYRLGVLGYLRLGHLLGEEFAATGNLGILDQIASLQWVRDNIAGFGGDPHRVTIFGESAGGAAVATLLGIPAAEGLFQRAIVQSGTAERARSVADSEAVTAAFLAAADLAEPASLLALPIADLLSAQERFVANSSRSIIGLPLPFQPTVDGQLLPMLPLEAVRRGVNGSVQVLTGTNLNEASPYTELESGSTDQPELTTGKLAVAFAEDFPAGDLDDYRSAVATTWRREVGDRQVLESLLTDRLYRQPTNRLLEARQRSTATYAYLFTWPTPVRGGRLGACHILDVPFVFRQLDSDAARHLVGDNPPLSLAEAMSAAWTSFAASGVPQASTLPAWPSHDPAARATMQLGTLPTLLHDPLGELRRFWLQPRPT